MSKQTAHEFVSNYYDVENGNEVCERKSFIRFRKAMPLNMDETAIENAYTAFSGKSPYYNKKAVAMSPWLANEYQNRANRIIDALTHDPTSFTDLATNARVSHTESLRKCFKAMAAAGIIECVEVKTCGKCHIRLYYLND